MTSEELATFVKDNIPNFDEIEVLGPGRAFHYTPHRVLIEKAGTFFGAPIHSELDFTQRTVTSQPASSDPGVVFAYEERSEAADEGYDQDVFEISFKSAVTGHHVQERDLFAPRSILILTPEIDDFKFIGACSRFRTV